MSDKRAYDRSILESHQAFEMQPVPEALRAKTEAASWPEDLLDRVLTLRRAHEEIEMWVDSGFPTVDMLKSWIEDQEQLMASTLVGRQATWSDANLMVELCRNAPEKVGDWSVTVERGPNPYAQYRLQEHPNVTILEDQRVALGMAANSVRNTMIGGAKTTANHMSGWRIRDGFRGLGLSRHLQSTPGPGTSWFGLVTYWFVRSGNTSSTWIDKVVTDMSERPEGFEMDTDALTASVTYFGHPDRGHTSVRVRPTTEADDAACIELINRTHDGLDLFRPYTPDYFDVRMSDPSWGSKPSFYDSVYDRSDHRVLEIDGEIVACGGLWDRGRDIREVWAKDDERFVVDPAAMMDFGFAAGQEAAMAELVSHLLAEAGSLGRSGLLAALEYTPEVAALTEELGSNVETRSLHVMQFSEPDLTVEYTIARPYMDLAYW